MDEEVPVEVPFQRLSEEVLRAIAEDFCTRDGTDYGLTEMPLASRIALLMRQLEAGQAHILFEATSQTLRIVTAEELPAAADAASAPAAEAAGDLDPTVIVDHGADRDHRGDDHDR